MQQRGPAPVLRLAAATLVAALGVVLLLVGLAVVLRQPAGGASDSAASVSPAAGVTPSAPAISTASPSSASSPSSSGASPSTPAGSGASVTIVGAGDIARCDGTDDEATAALVASLPGTVFTLGDNAYESGSPAEYRDCFGPSWGRFKDRIALPVPGNHEYETDGAAGYREYFGAAAVRDGHTWYSQDVGAWHVVVLDSTCDKVEGGCAADSPQVRWLRDDLAANTARCTLALFHHPRFSSGEHGNDDEVSAFWDALYAADADLVLDGHEHSYERFAPQDPDARPDDARGLTEIIVGTGGTTLRGFHDPVPNSLVRQSVAHGVISLELRPGGWGFTFRSVDGSFTDSGSGTCH